MRPFCDGARARERETQHTVKRKERAMYAWMNGWDWLWMTVMMGFWLVVLGAVIYLAVRLAHRPPTGPTHERAPTGSE